MDSEFNIGDYVEHCSLMPGILMSIDGDDVEIRILGDLKYNGKGFSCCSIKNCSVRKLSYELVVMMLFLGKERLGEIYKSLPHFDSIDEHYSEYDKRIKQVYLERTTIIS